MFIMLTVTPSHSHSLLFSYDAPCTVHTDNAPTSTFVCLNSQSSRNSRRITEDRAVSEDYFMSIDTQPRQKLGKIDCFGL